MFRTEGMLEMIAVSEIVYVESVNHRLEIVTTSERIEIPYKTCNSLLKELDSDNFVLCKRGRDCEFGIREKSGYGKPLHIVSR